MRISIAGAKHDFAFSRRWEKGVIGSYIFSIHSQTKSKKKQTGGDILKYIPIS
jgi:hypothetical protein